MKYTIGNTGSCNEKKNKLVLNFLRACFVVEIGVYRSCSDQCFCQHFRVSRYNILQRSNCLGIMIITGQAAHCAGENHESEHHQRNTTCSWDHCGVKQYK